jgi:hypothetical protein
VIGTGGLTALTTDELKLLLRAVHKGELLCPIDPIGLASTGLLRLTDHLGVLHGLDEAGVRAVLVCVLAERTRGYRPRAVV